MFDNEENVYRSHRQIAEEYNRRNPDDQISAQTVRKTFARAMKKLRRRMAEDPEFERWYSEDEPTE